MKESSKGAWNFLTTALQEEAKLVGRTASALMERRQDGLSRVAGSLHPASLSALIRSDVEHYGLVILDGWIASHTEACCYALVQRELESMPDAD
jgi:hypothetical protein